MYHKISREVAFLKIRHFSLNPILLSQWYSLGVYLDQQHSRVSRNDMIICTFTFQSTHYSSIECTLSSQITKSQKLFLLITLSILAQYQQELGTILTPIPLRRLWEEPVEGNQVEDGESRTRPGNYLTFDDRVVISWGFGHGKARRWGLEMYWRN